MSRTRPSPSRIIRCVSQVVRYQGRKRHWPADIVSVCRKKHSLVESRRPLSMKYRNLGNTGMHVSTLSFGKKFAFTFLIDPFAWKLNEVESGHYAESHLPWTAELCVRRCNLPCVSPRSLHSVEIHSSRTEERKKFSRVEGVHSRKMLQAKGNNDDPSSSFNQFSIVMLRPKRRFWFSPFNDSQMFWFVVRWCTISLLLIFCESCSKLVVLLLRQKSRIISPCVRFSGLVRCNFWTSCHE